MTDVYSSEDNIVRMRVQQQRRSVQQAVSDIDPDVDPDKAARAIQLGELSGTPPSVVNMDVDEHALQMRKQATFQILLRNASLRQFVDENPMGSKLAADDWSNLDEYTKRLEKAGIGKWGRAEARISHQFVQGFTESFQGVPNRSSALLEMPQSIKQYVPDEYGAVAQDLWSGSVGGLAYWPARGVELGLELVMRGVGGTIHGSIKAGEQVLKEFGAGDMTAQRIAREVGGMSEALMAAPLGMIPHPGAGVRAKHGELVRPVSPLEIHTAQHIEAARVAKPFLEAGEDIPQGLHPIWDRILADRAKYDREILDGIEEVADKDKLRERAPKEFANLTRIVNDLTVEINPEALLKLYGDTTPGVGDKLLGDRLPNIARQLADAIDHGDKVRIPLADYLLVEKEVRDALHDHVATRPNGLSLEESKLVPEPSMDLQPLAQTYPDGSDAGKFREALEAHKKATKSNPLFVREAESLQLLPVVTEYGTHGFDILDQTGRRVAELHLTRSGDGKNLHVEWFGGTVTPIGRPTQIANIFGPKLVRGLFQQVKEQFPEAETITGKRVSGAREGTPLAHEDVSIDIAALRSEFPENVGQIPGHEYTKAEYEKFWDMVHSGEWTRFNKFLEAQLAPTAELSAKQAALYSEIDQILSRVAPGIQHLAAREIRQEGARTQGIFQPFTDKAPVIIWALNALDPRATARHEAIHWLRTYNIITPKEWDVLAKAAIENDWIGKHKLDEIGYKGEPIITKIEEAIAHEFGEWGTKRAKEHAASGVFAKMMQVMTRIKNAVTRAFGREVTPEELFQQIESGKVGERGPQAPSPGRPGEPVPFDMRDVGTLAEEGAPYQVAGPMMAKFPKQLELPIRSAEEMPPIEPGAIMPKDRQERYLKKWDEQREAEQAAVDRIVARDVELRETKKWKDRSVDLLNEVEEKVRAQPEFLISNFFRRGVFYGDKVKDFMPKLDPKYLTPEQKAEVPKAWLKKDGFHPDEVAPLFNITSGDEMLARMGSFERLKGDLEPRKFFDRMVGMELEKRLEAEFGRKEDVIMQEVRDHQFGGRNWDLYHEDTMAMAMQAGQTPPISRGDFRAQARQTFSQKVMKFVSWPAIERMMYSAGGKLENAILSGDFAEAYRFAQAKEKAHLFGMEIKELISGLKDFNTTVGKYGKRELKGHDPTVTNFMHQILNTIGETTRRSDADIAREIEKNQSGYKDLRSFVEGSRLDGYDVYMPDFLYDPAWKKNVQEMTVEEFKAVNEAIQSMDAMSRKRMVQEVAGVKWAFDALIDRMVDTLKDLPTKAEEIRLDLPEGPMKDLLKRAWASSIQLEAMFNRFDQGNPLGIFNQAIVRKYATAANYQAAYDKKIGRILKTIEARFPIKQANKVVFQDIFKDPTTGEYIKMSRMNILAMLAYSGTPHSFYGMLDGYKVPRTRANDVMDLIRNNTFKEDWLRQQALDKEVWSVLKDDNDKMRRELSGIAPTRVETWNIVGPQGQRFDGWYHPIIYDHRFPQKNKEMAGKSHIEFPYWAKQVLPGAPFAKQRTGYVGPYMLEFDSFANRMQMMVRDTVWRPVLLDLQNIFRDDRFKGALSRHFGKQYTALLEPFLADIAGNQRLVDENAAIGMKAIQFLRQNVISHLVGFNPYTIAKHDLTALIQSITEVGATEFGKAFLSMIVDRDANSMGSMAFAMGKSEELQRRRKNYYENISGSFDRTFGDLMFSRDLKDTFDTFKERPVGEAARIVKGEMIARYMTLRDHIHYIEAAPLATLDLLSAVPTWTAKYRQAIVAGHDEGQATFLADRAVRRAHGSTVITNRPSIMRTNPFVASFVSFYAFFNHILMRQYEAAWATRNALHGQGYFVREPKVDPTTMETEPMIIERGGARGTKAEMEARAEDYKKSDAYKTGAYLIAPMAGMLVSYFIVPAWIEEIVHPHTSPQEAKRSKRGWGPIQGPKKDQMWLSYIAQVELAGLSGSWVGVRDIVHAAQSGGDVGAGVLGEINREILKLVQRGKKGKPKDLEETQKFLRNMNNLFNMGTGMGLPNSLPRMGVFGANWYTGKEKPQGFRDFWHGIGHGTLKEH
jgi:hypothetical protein